jgi:hypothetical protein
MAAPSRRTRTVRVLRRVTNVVVTAFVLLWYGSVLASVLPLLWILVVSLALVAGWEAALGAAGWAFQSLNWWVRFGLIPSGAFALTVELWERPAWLARRARRWRFHADSWDAPIGGEQTPAQPQV